MKLNRVYHRGDELPPTLPLFPLAGALLLPRRPMQLNVFEPRYLTMLDDALSAERLMGIIQPQAGEDAVGMTPELFKVGCVGRIVQFAELGDGRCFLTLMGVSRFRVEQELVTMTPYRIARVNTSGFENDFTPGAGEAEVDRQSLVSALREFAKANDIKVDWDDIEKAPNEALVNALSMMSPYGAKEKQAMLEAPDLKTRAEILVAVAQMELERTADAPRHLN